MDETQKTHRLSKVASELNVGSKTIIDFLNKKGFALDNNPNQKITDDMYNLCCKEYQTEKQVKEISQKLEIGTTSRNETITAEKTTTKAKSDEADKDPEKELIIKNVPVGYTKETEKQEVAPKEVKKVTTEKKTDDIPYTKPVSDTDVAAKKKEKKADVIETPVVETSVEETSIEVTPAEESKKESTRSKGPKIIGKIDLDELQTKKGKKTTEEKKPKTSIKKAKKGEKESELTEDSTGIIEQKELETQEEISVPDKKTKDTDGAEKEIEKKEPEGLTADETQEAEAVKETEEIKQPENFIKTQYQQLSGPVVLGKINLPDPTPPKPQEKKIEKVGSSNDTQDFKNKKKRKRIKPQSETPARTIEEQQPKGKYGKSNQGVKKFTQPIIDRQEPTDEEIAKQIKETLARLSPSKSKAAKYRRMKRDAIHQQIEEEQLKLEEDKKVLQITEFVTVNDLSKLMGVSVNEIIGTCMSLGMIVTINHRLDAEVLAIVADEFGFKTQFVSAEIQENLSDEQDDPAHLVERQPIVTVMGHVDHGKTSLLDYIRNANVIAGEAGGITQHIGAYEVTLENGKKITFLDTPGHEAFTAMRARGAKVTDIAIIVIAADDSVMPQTVEAINHAQAAKVPIIFAINKVDKPTANVDKIKEALAQMNYLVEDWGGKYQCQEISAKKGLNIDKLLEKILLEAEMLELKANPKKNAVGTILESSLEKGRGYVAKLLIQNGTLKVGDMVLAGCFYGRVKAMYNERNVQINSAGPAAPVLLLGLGGAPQAGDGFNVLDDEREAKDIANKRVQLQREQSIRTHKHITLDEIGRRIAIGDFKELNVIIKGDVDGSVEALSDSLLKLSTAEVQVNVIQKLVGQITESDVLLASASNAIIIGFQVRPSPAARKLAEQEQIDIRLYSIIYNAINELKSAIEGMLAPEIEEKIVCNLEVREVFKITKVGSIAGCFCLDGKINRNTLVRIIRNGIVVYSGKLGSLKRFKDDVKEVFAGQECGLNIENFNDIKVQDIIEGYEQTEIKRKLE